MKKIMVRVIVAINEQGIANKYPNFKINYENSDQGFTDFALNLMTREDTMSDFGFRVYVESAEDTDSIDYLRTENILERYDNVEYWDAEIFD
jgi:hypothetical protein